MLGRRAEPGGDRQGAELVAVQRDSVGLGLRRLLQIFRQGSAQMVVRLMSLPSSMRWPGTS